MLKQFNRMKSAHKYVLLFFAGLMGLSLVLFYAPGRNLAGAAPTSTEAVASVNGDEITVGDLTRLKETYSQFGMNMAQLGGDKRFLDGLIRDRITVQEARRLGLTASDAEVAAKVREQFPAAAAGSGEGFDRYKDVVTTRFGSVERFEQTLRDSIAAAKLRAFVTAGVTATEQEIKDDYQRKNTTFDITYVAVAADKLAAKLQPSDEELQKYYDEHKTNFRYLEPQKKVRYLFVDQAKAGERLNISDEDLRAEYNGLPEEHKQAGVRVQQIVLKVATPELDQTVLSKGTKLVADLRGSKGDATTTVDEQKFADAAKGNSEDPATAKGGGWLPAPVKRNPNKASELTQRTLDMREGEISDPVYDKTAKAYYIFRRGPSVPKTFEDAKQELLVSLRNRRAYKVAADLAARAEQRVKETKDLQKVAQELAKEANMTPAQMVKETPLIKPGDSVPDIGSSPQFEDALKPLENPGDVGARTPVKNGFAIPVLVEKRDPRIPDFAEVKDKVTESVRAEQAKGRLEQVAREIANAANSPADLKAAAEKYGLEARTIDKYRTQQPLEEAGISPAVGEAVYNLKVGEVTKTPVPAGDTWVVAGLVKRTDADLAEFNKQRDELLETELQVRRNSVYEDYVSALRARYEREGKIKIYDDVLTRLASEEEPPAALPANFPIPTGGGK
ncbi:MAG TPA: SurA N-terminal domain-containing protein [Pyrinomonadaceae bacterium]|jgi:peptidyl-prolyl cis-trans isomerase D